MIETIAIITVAFSAGFLLGAAWAGRTTGDEDHESREHREPRGPQTANAVEDSAPHRSGVVTTLREVKS